RLAWGNATPLHPDLDLDQATQLDTELLRCAGGRVDLLRRVEAERDGGVLCQRSQPPQLAVADHLVADQHVLHTTAYQRLRLADLLHALADRAPRDLPQRDGRRFVGLGVRPHAHAGRAAELGHLRDVAVERVEVDDQRRRLDVVEERTDLGRRWI